MESNALEKLTNNIIALNIVAKAGRPAVTYIQKLCAHAGYRLKNLPGAINDRDGWRERVREIHASSAT